MVAPATASPFSASVITPVTVLSWAKEARGNIINRKRPDKRERLACLS